MKGTSSVIPPFKMIGKRNLFHENIILMKLMFRPDYRKMGNLQGGRSFMDQ